MSRAPAAPYHEARCEPCDWRSGPVGSEPAAEDAVRAHGRYTGSWQAEPVYVTDEP